MSEIAFMLIPVSLLFAVLAGMCYGKKDFKNAWVGFLFAAFINIIAISMISQVRKDAGIKEGIQIGKNQAVQKMYSALEKTERINANKNLMQPTSAPTSNPR